MSFNYVTQLTITIALLLNIVKNIYEQIHNECKKNKKKKTE